MWLDLHTLPNHPHPHHSHYHSRSYDSHLLHCPIWRNVAKIDVTMKRRSSRRRRRWSNDAVVETISRDDDDDDDVDMSPSRPSMIVPTLTSPPTLASGIQPDRSIRTSTPLPPTTTPTTMMTPPSIPFLQPSSSSSAPTADLREIHSMARELNHKLNLLHARRMRQTHHRVHVSLSDPHHRS